MAAVLLGIVLRDQVDNRIVSVTVSPKPMPAGRYAAFVSKDGNVLIISNAALRIVRVASVLDLPSGLRVPQGTRGFATEFSYFDGSKAFLLSGDVDVDVGDLLGEQQATAALLANRNDIKRIALKFDPLVARGPPPRQRPEPEPVHVFVVGRIRSFQGPAQYRSSALSGSVVDLYCSDDQFAEYLRNVDRWVNEIRAKAGISGELPASEIWRPETDGGEVALHVIRDHIYPEHGSSHEREQFRLQERTMFGKRPPRERRGMERPVVE